MDRGRGLGIKLLLISVSGLIVLALLLTGQMTFSLLRVRDQALQNTITGLENQSRTQLPLLHEQMAARIQERLDSIADGSLTIARAMLAANSQQLIASDYAQNIALTELPNGALADLRPGRITSIYVPPGNDRAAVAQDLGTSALLDTLLPQQLLAQRQNILAAAYVGPSGMVRIYPAVDVREQTFDFEQALFREFSQRGGRPTWLAPFRPESYIQTVDPRITAVVMPIYAGQTYQGILITYVSLGSLTADLIGIQPTPQSLVFVIANDHQLVAASERFIPFLTNQSFPANQTMTLSQTISPDFDRIIAQMVTGKQGLEDITLRDRRYIITYQSITETGWSLGVAVPVDELTQSAATVAEVVRSSTEQTLWTTLLTTALFVVVAILAGIYFTRRLTRPLGELAEAAHSIGQGEGHRLVSIRSKDEIGEVADAFNTMSRSILAAQEQLRAANRELEAIVDVRTTDLKETVSQLESALTRQSDLDSQLRNVATPVIPVASGVLLLPLIGVLDTDRLQHAIQALLQRVALERVRDVILDITGIPTLNAEIARALISLAASLHLMGARTILTGIRPEVAELLMDLGADLGGIQPIASLQDALSFAFQRTIRTPQDAAPSHGSQRA
jgi:anti-anti-sigma regulatory factor/HAMP domain-containing protein